VEHFWDTDNANPNTHTEPNRYSVTDCDPHRYTAYNTDGDTHRNSECDTYRNTYCDTYCDTDCDTYSDSRRYADG